MNRNVWDKNLALFKRRFPQLADLFSAEIARFDAVLSADGADASAELFPFWKVSFAKNGSPTAQEDGLRLHSAYNPEREAQNALGAETDAAASARAIVLLGFGLGYAAVHAARLFPQKAFVLVEPEAARFFAALLFLDWTDVFSCPDIALAISCTPEQAMSLVNRHPAAENIVFQIKAQTEHSRRYFDTIQAMIARNVQKEEVNRATFRTFARLWLRNSLRNARTAALSDSVARYRNKAKGIPFVVLAAGPSLASVLPHLMEIKERAVIVCVDTALRSCLRAGAEPDFIVLTDPQYWAYRHIAGLSAPSSILIAEAAVYPAVFRFPCRKIVCCSSQLPVGRFFERFCGEKGDLGAGGSVASAAWNFAEFAGATTIFVAGLDLSFPEKQTHIRGSTFEESAHRTATRLRPAETAGAPLLLSGGISGGHDYAGRPVLTDRRMQLFAWWFESRLAACPSVHTYALSDRGLAIPGISPTDISALRALPKISAQKSEFLRAGDVSASGSERTERARQFSKASALLERCMADAFEKAGTALLLCRQLSEQRVPPPEAERRLEAFAADIQNCAAKEILSLLLRGWTLPPERGGSAENSAVRWQRVFEEARSLMELFIHA